MAGGKVPMPHRFHMANGRVIEGDLHRLPKSRLADHLSTLKGFLSVTQAHDPATGEHFPYLVLNMDHLLFIEEVMVPAQEAQPLAGNRGASTFFAGR